MTVISMRQITPKIGKTELVTNRVTSMAGIVARAGARVRIGNVVGGEGAGSLHMYAAWENFESLSSGTVKICLLYTSPSPRDKRQSRMPSSA